MTKSFRNVIISIMELIIGVDRVIQFVPRPVEPVLCREKAANIKIKETLIALMPTQCKNPDVVYFNVCPPNVVLLRLRSPAN